ncbi:amino acid adenylation domain-containing protein [Sphingomonas canadensis]|uniref:Amino acid adenylation domain-containing protein n=1 Tax=Sphingomonas canadensis TaxID=1219257 RepID=A0ABW3H659_9SPHN|nr:amino acid adenylation domain-containing protein [Sphingomonas canadensis]MCW3836908.1 amino acid adenylation domain-containing protein [Sphingomonas canadensis]
MRTLHGLLRASAERFPVSPAIADGERTIGYAALDDLSDRLCARLFATGVAPGDRVALWIDKSWLALVALFAVLKCGATYVPVDPRAPRDRALFILGDCEVRLVAADAAHAAMLDEGGIPVLLLDEDMLAALSADALPGLVEDPETAAYILYTSGSTGEPKGVVISHRAALSVIGWAAGAFAISPGDRLSSHAPLHFDLSVIDIFAAVAAGACVALVPPPAMLFPRALAEWIAASGVTIWYSVPGALMPLAALREVARFPALRLVLLAGERLPPALARWLAGHVPQAALFNLYGPTETNVVTAWRVPKGFAGDEIPIGRATGDAAIRIVDPAMRTVAGGERGEILVSGATLMTGYWHRPEQTAAALVTLPGETGRWYRTGDHARMDGAGALVFLGRADNQIKLRGHRVELEEIEAVLLRDEAVSAAIVGPVDDVRLGAVLIAAVTGPDLARIDTAGLIKACRSALPAYMIPLEVRAMRTLPLTTTGKVDRAAVRAMLAGDRQ